MSEIRTALAAHGLRIHGDDRSWEAIGADPVFRYALGRSWDRSVFDLAFERHPDRKVMLFVLHNPSTADHRNDDPTLKKCIAIAQREKCGGLILTNVMSYRATDKRDLRDVVDVVGPRNHEIVKLCSGFATTRVVAWGNLFPHVDALASAHRTLDDLAALSPLCLGTNKDGSPKHPLFLPSATPLVPFTRASSPARPPHG